MADNSGASPQEALDYSRSPACSSGFAPSCNASPLNLPSADAAVQLQSSRRGYRQLFFDCNLHLVLQRMLSKKPFQSSRESVAVSQGVLSSSQDDTAQELTDAEVARLMRQHLNILSTNQGASEAEVVKAAKTLQMRFLPTLAGSLQLPKTEDQGKETLQHGGLEGNKGVPKMQADCEGDSAARLSAKDMTLGSSEAACIWLRDSRLDCLGSVGGSPASDVEHGMTGLQLSQSQDPHAVEVGETAANFQQASVDVTTILQCDMNHTLAREDSEQPRKKVCLELHGLST